MVEVGCRCRAPRDRGRAGRCRADGAFADVPRVRPRHRHRRRGSHGAGNGRRLDPPRVRQASRTCQPGDGLLGGPLRSPVEADRADDQPDREREEVDRPHHVQRHARFERNQSGRSASAPDEHGGARHDSAAQPHLRRVRGARRAARNGKSRWAAAGVHRTAGRSVRNDPQRDG